MATQRTSLAGKLVAIEGLPEDALDTQLRLLPSSTQILVLPSIQHYLEHDDHDNSDDDNDTGNSNPRHQRHCSAAVSAVQPYSAPNSVGRYIRRVHAAATARRDIALAFLRDNNPGPSQTHTGPTSQTRTAPDASATPAAERVVLLNGGTASSHALCIEAIRKNDASVDASLDRAGLLFHKLIAGGVAGLNGVPRINLWNASSRTHKKSSSRNESIFNENFRFQPNDADPNTNAMRAADALDRQTAALQISTDTIDLTTDNMRMGKRRQRSLSSPARGELPRLSRSDSRSELDDMSSINDMYASFARFMPSSTMSGSRSPTRTYRATSPGLSPTCSPTSTIFPVSMRLDAIAEQSQNRLNSCFGLTPEVGGPTQDARGRSRFRPSIQMQSSDSESLGPSFADTTLCMSPRRTQSLERGRSYSRHSLGSNFLLSSSRETSLRRESYLSDASVSAASVAAASGMSYYETASVLDVPCLPSAQDLGRMAYRRQVAKASFSSLCSSGALSRPSVSYRSFSKKSASYFNLDSLRDYQLGDGLMSPLEGAETFEEVLPVIEDVVIHFDDGSNASQALGVAVQCCKGLCSAQLRHQHRRLEQEKQANSEGQPGKDTTASLPMTPISAGYKKEAALTSSMDDYDSYAPHEYKVSPRTVKPPTPARTPTPDSESDEADDSSGGDASEPLPYFYSIDTGDRNDALSLNSALRKVLSKHVAPAAPSTSAVHDVFSYLPGMSTAETWMPLFEDVGLVLAIGSEDDVPSELNTEITSQLEYALGMSSGMGRCGRVDVRYLVANAMQALAAQQGGSPHEALTAESKALAILVMKQLDLYLRTHATGSSSPMRTVLLDYPLGLMSIVATLRQLTGRDLVHVASVIDADEEPGFQTLQESPPPSLPSSVGRANYVLTSTASDADVCAFVTAVRGMLAMTPYSQQQQQLQQQRWLKAMGRNSSLSTATTAAGVGSPSMPARKPLQTLARKSSTSTVRHSPQQTTRPQSPAPSAKSQMSKATFSSEAASILSQRYSWCSSKPVTTSLAPAPAIVPCTRLVAKKIQVGPRRSEPARPVLTMPQHQLSPTVSSRPSSRSLIQAQPPMAKLYDYNDADYDFDGMGYDGYDGYDDEDDEIDNDQDMRRLMPLFMRDRKALFKSKEASGLRSVGAPSTRSKQTGCGSSSVGSGSASSVLPSPSPRRPMTEFHQHSPATPASQAVRPRTSLNSTRSVRSIHSSHSQGGQGSKARKWLGLA